MRLAARFTERPAHRDAPAAVPLGGTGRGDPSDGHFVITGLAGSVIAGVATSITVESQDPSNATDTGILMAPCRSPSRVARCTLTTRLPRRRRRQRDPLFQRHRVPDRWQQVGHDHRGRSSFTHAVGVNDGRSGRGRSPHDDPLRELHDRRHFAQHHSLRPGPIRQRRHQRHEQRDRLGNGWRDQRVALGLDGAGRGATDLRDQLPDCRYSTRPSASRARWARMARAASRSPTPRLRPSPSRHRRRQRRPARVRHTHRLAPMRSGTHQAMRRVTTFSISAGGTCVANVCHGNMPGVHTVTGRWRSTTARQTRPR